MKCNYVAYDISYTRGVRKKSAVYGTINRSDIGLYENFEKLAKVEEKRGKSTIKRVC
jgi:hypothetical protein